MTSDFMVIPFSEGDRVVLEEDINTGFQEEEGPVIAKGSVGTVTSVRDRYRLRHVAGHVPPLYERIYTGFGYYVLFDGQETPIHLTSENNHFSALGTP